MLHLAARLDEGCVDEEFVAGLFMAGAQSLCCDWRWSRFVLGLRSDLSPQRASSLGTPILRQSGRSASQLALIEGRG